MGYFAGLDVSMAETHVCGVAARFVQNRTLGRKPIKFSQSSHLRHQMLPNSLSISSFRTSPKAIAKRNTASVLFLTNRAATPNWQTGDILIGRLH